MEFIYKNNTLSIESEKKSIEITPEALILDGMRVDMAGEYEKGGFLLYVHRENGVLISHFRAEGYWIVSIPTVISDISGELLESLGNVDVLIMPGSKSLIPILEKFEPRLLVTYWESAHELALSLSVTEPPVMKYKMKEADLSSEKTWCVIMWE